MNNVEKTMAKITNRPKVTRAEKEALVEAIRLTLKNFTCRNVLVCDLTPEAASRILKCTPDERIEIIQYIAQILGLNLLQFANQLDKKLPEALRIICSE